MANKPAPPDTDAAAQDSPARESASTPATDTEQALRDRNHALEQRVNELSQALDELIRHGEQLEHGISHDLRAPLRTISSFAGLLPERLQAGDEAGALDYLERIRTAAARAGDLIDALLDLSRAGRSPLRLQEVDVSLLADWALVELQDTDRQRTASVQVQRGLSVAGDEHLLRQLLQQVLHNAWKFSGDAPIRIDVSGQRDGDRLHLQIDDAGSGFDMAYAGKLFEPFQRLHGADSGGGHGLGLAIAQRIVARHGGRIWAQSQVGTGSTFHIELPIKQNDKSNDKPTDKRWT